VKDSKRRKNPVFLNDDQKLMQPRLLDITCIMGGLEKRKRCLTCGCMTTRR